MKRFAVIGTTIGFVVCLMVGAVAQEGDLAKVLMGPGRIEWQPSGEYAGLTLTVSMPDGQVIQDTFPSGTSPYLHTSKSRQHFPNGGYTWELQVAATDSPAVRTEEDAAGPKSMRSAPPAPVQSGHFRIVRGRIVRPAKVERDAEGPSGVTYAKPPANTAGTKDQVIQDDQIIVGSGCFGQDCSNGESFGFDTIRLKENNLRIKFQDTSNSSSFPSNDWQITANDSSNGGQNKFSIDDIDGGRTPFTLEAGAPSHSLYVDDGGRLGLGTSTPVVDVHVVSGNTPTLRLEQNGSSGFTPQTFDVASNEANFFIRDATNGSTLPFRIQPGAPNNVLYLASDADVGIGTSSPDYPLHLWRDSSTPATFVAQRSGYATAYMRADEDHVAFGSITEHPVRIRVGAGTHSMVIEANTDGQVGIGTAPSHPVHLLTPSDTNATIVAEKDGGAKAYMDASNSYASFGSITSDPVRLTVAGVWKMQFNADKSLQMASGGSCTAGGVWTSVSNRESKQDIHSLGAEEAMDALDGLEPVTYRYKAEQDETYVGFISNDVPELVATNDRKGMNPMDVAAVLTKVVQEQQKVIAELTSRIEQIEEKAGK